MRIVINTSSFGKQDAAPLERLRSCKVEFSLNPHKRTLTQDEVIKISQGADGMIAGTEPLNAQVLGQLSGLKVISRCGVGMDNVDLGAAEKLGIKVFSTPSGPTVAVAELTVGLILDLLRKVSSMDRQLRAGKWDKQMGNLLFGKKVGIVGFGRIGQRVAQLLEPFGCEIGFYDAREVWEKLSHRFGDLNSLLSWADIITVHASWENQGGAMIGASQLKLMKPGGWLVNVARGGVVDETALAVALKSGQLAGAALDVFAQEPYSGPLKDLEQVILTPHIGSYAAEARIAMEKEAVENLLQGLQLS